MIYFRDVALEAIAPARIVDVLVSPIGLNPLVHERPVRPGSTFVRAKDGERTVQITFALLTQDREARAEQMTAIYKWARSDAPGALRLPGYSGRHLTAICTGLPEPSTRQWWESKLRITFTCFDPYWTADAIRTVACGTAFTPIGSAVPRLRILRTLSSAASNQSYSNGDQTMTFSSIPAGALVIDLDAQTAAVGSTSVIQYLSFSSRFLQPKPGAQTITGTGSVEITERWA